MTNHPLVARTYSSQSTKDADDGKIYRRERNAALASVHKIKHFIEIRRKNFARFRHYGSVGLPRSVRKADREWTIRLFDYSTERQRIPFHGPIPSGQYWIQPSQLWENNWLKSALHSPRAAWGNLRITIHPYPHTQTHGRGGFFIHGGAAAGSAGCIDLVHYIDRFVERLKQELGGLPECYVPLTVQY